MVFRTAGAIAALLTGLGLSGGSASAQYYPPAQAYPPPQAYPPAQGYPAYRPLPPVADADDNQIYDLQGRPLPPAAVEPVAPAPRYGHGGAGLSRSGDTAAASRVIASNKRRKATARPIRSYASPRPVLNPNRTARGRRCRSAPARSAPDKATRTRPAPWQRFPPEVRPETGPKKQLPPQFRRTLVDYSTKEPAGTIIIDTPNTYLYLVLGQGKALRYGIGVGREGFTWSGAERVTKMAEWPDWTPPEEMIVRQPYLPRFMAGGDTNPLGARALYLGKTIYRIHGTNQPSTIGTFVSSGCIRLTNDDVTDLFTRVKVGTRVVVMPGKPPPTAAASAPAAAAAPSASATASVPSSGGAVTSAPLGPPPSAMAR